MSLITQLHMPNKQNFVAQNVSQGSTTPSLIVHIAATPSTDSILLTSNWPDSVKSISIFKILKKIFRNFLKDYNKFPEISLCRFKTPLQSVLLFHHFMRAASHQNIQHHFPILTDPFQIPHLHTICRRITNRIQATT